MRKLTVLLSLLIMAGLSLHSYGQVEVQVQEAELSVPFGVAEGKLVLVGNYLIYVDDDNPRDSFALTRDQISQVNSDESTVMISTTEPVMFRNDSRSELNFRMRRSESAPALANWARAASRTTESDVVRGMADTEILATYEAKHDHGFLGGSCTGQLLMTVNGIAYDSVDQISHSRRWKLTDIKELKLKNPYELEIDVFTGNDYNLALIGKGMDNERFQQLRERIAEARITN